MFFVLTLFGIIGGIILLFILYLLVLAILPGISAPAIPLDHVEADRGRDRARIED